MAHGKLAGSNRYDALSFKSRNPLVDVGIHAYWHYTGMILQQSHFLSTHNIYDKHNIDIWLSLNYIYVTVWDIYGFLYMRVHSHN